eukprot:m.427671 g.427671  ORF g.427671 m.427671 type:complete len:165 (-) comp21363_c1_seq17:2048-2542(-)
MRALRRLMKEYKEIKTNGPHGILAGPVDEENFFEWEAVIAGPEGTALEGGLFTANLSFPKSYPNEPPKMTFTNDMFHPNIYKDGKVCISILHTAEDDPGGYELPSERWSPVQSIEKILLSVVSMLAEPNDESAANIDAAKMWREDRDKFTRISEQVALRSLGFV